VVGNSNWILLGCSNADLESRNHRLLRERNEYSVEKDEGGCRDGEKLGMAWHYPVYRFSDLGS
jgi:hypothetical protein